MIADLPDVTSLYAGLCALMLVGLSARVIRRRRKARVGLGHGDDSLLERRIRAQGNFAEYVPLALVLILVLETGGASAWLLHLLGVALLLGRLVHAWALETASGAGRQLGMILTFGVLAVAGLRALTLAGQAAF